MPWDVGRRTLREGCGDVASTVSCKLLGLLGEGTGPEGASENDKKRAEGGLSRQPSSLGEHILAFLAIVSPLQPGCFGVKDCMYVYYKSVFMYILSS